MRSCSVSMANTRQRLPLHTGPKQFPSGMVRMHRTGKGANSAQTEPSALPGVSSFPAATSARLLKCHVLSSHPGRPTGFGAMRRRWRTRGATRPRSATGRSNARLAGSAAWAQVTTFWKYRRWTTSGLIHQGWKDSVDGVNDTEGRTAEPPIALCEVQGYLYAALLTRAELADAFGDPAHATQLRERADTLRGKFLEAFWLPKKGWYAIALDGSKHHVDALTSNIAHCLWTGIATDEHAAAIIERLSGQEMDSGFGLRTLDSTMGAYNPMSHHNGSVWPHDTAIAVAGLLRYRHLPGAVRLAERLANGLLDAADAFDGRLPELFCGFPRSRFGQPVPYPTACSPQAWASAAPLLLVRSFLGLTPHVPQHTLTVIPHLPQRWGKLALTDLRLGPATVRVEAEGETVSAHGVPYEWRVVTS